MEHAEFTFKNPRKISILTAAQKWEEWMISVGRSPATVANSVVYVRAWVRDQKLEGSRPSNVAENVIGTWINRQSPAKAGTRSVALSALRTFFRFCSAKGYCVGNPAELVEVNYRTLSQSQKEKKTRVTFTDEEVALLLAQPDPFWRAAVAISRWTGLRLGDCATMEWSAVSKNKFVLFTRKTSKRIEIPFYHPTLVRIVETIHRIDPQYLFPEQRAICIDPKRRPLLSWRFSALCKRLGIEGKSFHALRHSFAQDRYDRGQTMEGISRALTHSNESTTSIYVKR